MKFEQHRELLQELFSTVSLAPEEGPSTTCLPNVYSACKGKVVLAEYWGSIGLPCLQRFAPSLHEILNADVERVVISLKDVSKLSRSAVGMLLDFAAGVLGRGKELFLYCPPKVIEDRLRDLDLTAFFRILRSEDDLVGILPVEEESTG